jgi:hypothetical protein
MLLIWSVVGLLPLLAQMVAAATLRVLAAGGALRLYRLVAFMVDVAVCWSKVKSLVVAVLFVVVLLLLLMDDFSN